MTSNDLKLTSNDLKMTSNDSAENEKKYISKGGEPDEVPTKGSALIEQEFSSI